jgi:hypothetical protein
MKDIYDIIRDLYDAYGKPYNEKQIVMYTNWARTCNLRQIQKTVNLWIDLEKFFPSLADLKRVYASFNRTSKNSMHYDECWYCGGTGFVPAIETHIDRDVMTNYVCKCSNAVTKGVSSYFQKYPTIQLERYSRSYKDEYSYPQIVDRYFKEIICGLPANKGQVVEWFDQLEV